MSKVKPAEDAKPVDGIRFIGTIIGYIILGYLISRAGYQLSDFEMWLGVFVVFYLQYAAFSWCNSSSK